MEVKKILEKIHQREEKKRYFFAVQLDDGLVKSALWTTENGVVKILKIGETQFWEEEKEILQAVDASLPLLEGKEPSEVIFGVPPSWVKENKVIPTRLEVLKKICKELELVALGFVITPEAIVYHLKTSEGIPTTAILVALGKKELTVVLVRLGKIIGIETVKRSGELGADLAEGISRFGKEETFPPRIILYNYHQNLEEEKQQLMNFSWDSFEINFLHLPKLEVLPKDFDTQSVALAGGREIEGAQKIEFTSLGMGEVKEAKEEIGAEKISEEKTEELKEEEEETMGFVRGKDVTQEIPVSPPSQAEFPSSPLKLNFPKPNLVVIFNFFSKISNKLRGGLKFFGGLITQRTGKAWGLAIAFLIAIAGIFFALWWYLPKAEITLWIKPQTLEKDFTIKLNPKLQTADMKNLVLPAEEVAVVLTGEKSTSTSGTKLVGESAKGEVVIYNGVGIEKKFPAGTVITSNSGIKFTLDEDVVLASRSSAADPTPTKKVKVTAVNIGAEGNLSSGTEFIIGNFSKSDFVAKNEEAFSGGTSREVQVVSKKDQDKLIEELSEELKNRAVDELRAKIGPEKRMIEESITSSVVSKTFDKNVEEEAEKVNLKLEAKFTALSFSEKEFRNLIEEEIWKAVPQGFEYKPEEGETSFSLKNITKEGIAVFTAHFKASLFPSLDLEAIKKNLAGKYPNIGQAYLSTLPSVESFEIRITPQFPSRLATFPRVAKNIKIEIRKK